MGCLLKLSLKNNGNFGEFAARTLLVGCLGERLISHARVLLSTMNLAGTASFMSRRSGVYKMSRLLRLFQTSSLKKTRSKVRVVRSTCSYRF